MGDSITVGRAASVGASSRAASLHAGGRVARSDVAGRVAALERTFEVDLAATEEASENENVLAIVPVTPPHDYAEPDERRRSGYIPQEVQAKKEAEVLPPPPQKQGASLLTGSATMLVVQNRMDELRVNASNPGDAELKRVNDIYRANAKRFGGLLGFGR